ncbi:MAG: hypothetical protein IPJ38_13740 [Dechloromonas sp.]|uniref:Uncharacterized protein n=1 Tax=Candidatus Dechloromonas phosphorivorans TaxID=2899244 RepID=A0A935MTU2_9RHOO|nr:hypothetical protein [Candidatus Dechloromonas phosphorivorans]
MGVANRVSRRHAPTCGMPAYCGVAVADDAPTVTTVALGVDEIKQARQ